VCPTCGAPWRRIVERTKVGEREKAHEFYGPLRDTGNHGTMGVDGAGKRYDTDYALERRTVGWDPTCKCPAHTPIPAVVFDPFMGSGTTAVVALQEGRNYIGSELQPKYVALAERRILRETGYLSLLNAPVSGAHLEAQPLRAEGTVSAAKVPEQTRLEGVA
jgi:hypothetical protein